MTTLRLASLRLLGAILFGSTLLLFAGCAAGGGGGGGESDYPTEDIEFIVPYSPGGGYDAWARLLAPFIEEHLPGDVSVVVRNEPGASGQTAANQLYAAEPDGTQIEIMNLNGLAAAQLAGETSFDLDKFTYLGTVTIDPYVLSVAGNSSIDTVEDLEEAEPINQAITGFASGDGVATVILYDELGIEYTPIRHEGSSEARLSVIRGDSQASIYPVESILGELQSGDLKPILYIGEPLEEGAPGYEEVRGVQTVESLGYPELNDLEAPRVIAAPPNLPDDIRQVLDQAIQDALNDPELIAQAEESEVTPVPRDADETTELVNETLNTFSKYEDALREAIESQ